MTIGIQQSHLCGPFYLDLLNHIKIITKIWILNLGIQ